MRRATWLRGLFQRRSVEREFDDETALHVEMETQENTVWGWRLTGAPHGASHLNAFGPSFRIACAHVFAQGIAVRRRLLVCQI